MYLNFAGFGDEGDLATTSLGRHHRRLATIRGGYDPDDLFAQAARRP